MKKLIHIDKVALIFDNDGVDLTYKKAKEYIQSDYPLHTNVDYYTKTGHAVVVRGYYDYTNTTDYVGQISYMDSLSGRYEAVGVKSNTGTIHYTDPNGVTGDFSYYIAVGA